MLIAYLLLWAWHGAWAQGIAAPAVASEGNGGGAGNFTRTTWVMASMNSSNDFLGAPAGSASFAVFSAPVASAALDTAAPEPQVFARGSEKGGWQLGVGFTYVKFRSPAIDAGMEGLNTSVTYFPNDWLGVEGNITAAFGRKIFANDRARYAGITGGPKIVMRQGRWEPWAHALFGIAHVNPQLAGVSKNGVAIQLGGGADYNFPQPISLRFEGDWVRTQLYALSQNNFQVVTGFVFHF